MEDKVAFVAPFPRILTLSLLGRSAERIKRTLLELAIASDIDPDDLTAELDNPESANVLSDEDYSHMKSKLIFWIDREKATLDRLKADVQNIPIK